MAKGKGKSRRRLRDWQHRLREGELDDASPRRQSVTAREVKIPAHRLAAPQENMEDLPKAEGMVIGFFPGGAIVRKDREELLCGIAKTFRAPENASHLAVGDRVTVALTRHVDGDTESDKVRTDGFLIARTPRRTLLARPQPTSGKYQDIYETETFLKVIVANVDQLLVVVSMRQPRCRRALIDRFLIVAERGELRPILIVNKIDLARPDEQFLDDLLSTDLQVCFCSAETGEGIEELARHLTDQASVFAGPSGVGKSTLVNALIPGADALTRKVRSKDMRGRHTTSAAVVYDLPKGGMIVDTPGIRELGMDLTAQELPWYFPEFGPYVHDCRFNDCTHTHEPDCAVTAAVESGAIDARRYESYVRILETL